MGAAAFKRQGPSSSIAVRVTLLAGPYQNDVATLPRINTTHAAMAYKRLNGDDSRGNVEASAG